MSRYFFNIYNGTQSLDDIGSECADAAEVRAEAVETMQELFSERLLNDGATSSMTINVVDGEGKTVMIVSASAYVETVAGSSLAV